MYFQCAKALMRSGLWQGLGGDTKVPTAGDFVKERDALFDGKAYDENTRNMPNHGCGKDLVASPIRTLHFAQTARGAFKFKRASAFDV